MIGFLKGELIDVHSDGVLVLCHGVGYEIQVSAPTLSHLEFSLSKEVVLWIYTHVREDALTLFGFCQKLEKELFLQLLKVNGVGPKMALNILSGASFEQIFEMIEGEDVKALSKLPKVGKKTAEQMILTLKGKLVLNSEGTPKKSGMTPPVAGSTQKELTSALVNLGFRPADVDRVVGTLPKDIDFESNLKMALANLSSL